MGFHGDLYGIPSGWWFQPTPPTPLKNDGVRQIGSSSQLLGKIKSMFQTTNQFIYCEDLFSDKLKHELRLLLAMKM